MRRVLVVLLLVLIAALAVTVWRDTRQRLAVGRLCDAVESGDWRRGLDDGPALVGVDEPGLMAAECLAMAHFGAQDPAAAVAVLETALDGSDTWAPRPLLSMAVIESRRREGRARAAATVARRAAAAHPHDPRLVVAELDTRLETEDTDDVLDHFEARLDAMGPATALRAALALKRAERRELAEANRLLGDGPDPRSPRATVDEWYRVRAAVDAMAGDAKAVAETARRWVASGGRRAEVLAWHAVTLSLYQLDDPDFPVLALLNQAADRRSELKPEQVVQVYRRLIGTLIVAGKHDEALVRLAEIEALVGPQDLGVTRDDIERSREQTLAEQDSSADPAAAIGRIRFAPPPDWRGTLFVSPDLDESVDAPWRGVEIASAEPFAIDRRVGQAPQRWVLRDTDGETHASGTVWPRRGQVVEVTIEATAQAPRRSFALPEARPGDGVRRLRGLVLDCADWRLLQYLRVRGDLPVLDALLGAGRSAVVWSDPPFTAAAMDALVSPTDRPAVGVFAALQAFGSELGSNPFFGGVDPLAGVGALVRSEPSLFATIGAGRHSALNLLFAKGKVEAGRHGEVVGPNGQTRRWEGWRDSRPLTDAERAAIPGELDGLWRIWFESTAAVLDAFDTAAASDLDLVLTRVAAFDSATHGGFAHAVSGGQDDGEHRLYDLYRYVDRRLAQTLDTLDADDVLVVFSDHGIRTAMEHDERSFFVAYGGGGAPGRVPGRPALRGVPRLFAEWLGVETTWPWMGFDAGFPELAEATP